VLDVRRPPKMVIAARQAGLAAIDLDLVSEGLVEPLLGQKDLRDAFKSGKGARYSRGN
jgi:hypothetical protein